MFKELVRRDVCYLADFLVGRDLYGLRYSLTMDSKEHHHALHRSPLPLPLDVYLCVRVYVSKCTANEHRRLSNHLNACTHATRNICKYRFISNIHLILFHGYVPKLIYTHAHSHFYMRACACIRVCATCIGFCPCRVSDATSLKMFCT